MDDGGGGDLPKQNKAREELREIVAEWKAL